MEKDPTRYKKYFNIWIYGIALSFTTACVTAFLLRNLNHELLVPLIVGLLLIPLVVASMYGFINGYSMSHRYGYIYKGASSVFTNILSMAIFFFSLYIAITKEIT